MTQLIAIDSAFATSSDDSEDSSDFAFAAPPTTLHSIDIADSSDSAFAAKNIYVASEESLSRDDSQQRDRDPERSSG